MQNVRGVGGRIEGRIRNLSRAGVSSEVAMQLCGHETPRIDRRYRS
jgi:hypothetical protein